MFEVCFVLNGVIRWDNLGNLSWVKVIKINSYFNFVNFFWKFFENIVFIKFFYK